MLPAKTSKTTVLKKLLAEKNVSPKALKVFWMSVISVIQRKTFTTKQKICFGQWKPRIWGLYEGRMTPNLATGGDKNFLWDAACCFQLAQWHLQGCNLIGLAQVATLPPPLTVTVLTTHSASVGWKCNSASNLRGSNGLQLSSLPKYRENKKLKQKRRRRKKRNELA